MDPIFNILSEAKKSGITIELLNGEDLELSIIHEDFDQTLISRIKDNKAEIIDYLKRYSKKATIKISKISLADNYTMSYSQKRLWILSQFSGGNNAYNMTGVYRLIGDLNIKALKEAIYRVIERHEILRTYFADDDQNEVKQFVISISSIQEAQIFEYFDFRTHENSLKKLKKSIQNDYDTSFDLHKAPLITTKLYHLAENDFCFLFSMHHIVSDGWSMGIFFNELFHFYKQGLANLPINLPPLQIQYKDYAAWQNNYLASSDASKDENYWLEQFKGEIPVLNLPTDRPYPHLQSYNGSYEKILFSKEITHFFKQHCKEANGTMFMTVLSLVYIILKKYTSQTDIIIGSPIAGRDIGELENQIGFYVNTLALRIKGSNDETYNSIFSKIREIALGAYAHQNYPFNKLIENLDIERDLSRNTLFEVMVAMHNIENLSSELVEDTAGLIIKEYNEIENCTSKFSLFFNFSETNEQLNLRLEYNTDLFDKETIQRLILHLEQLMKSIIEKPNHLLNDLQLIDQAEKQKLLIDFNNTSNKADVNKTYVKLFEEQVRINPNKIILTVGDTHLTYLELNERANQISHYIKDNYNVLPDQIIGIILDRNEFLILGILAILKAGAAYVPIDTSYPKHRVKYILNDTQAPLILTNSKYVDLCTELQWEVEKLNSFICLDEYIEKSYEEYENDMRSLWNYTAKKADSVIAASGWLSSETKEAFSDDEMEEFADNVYEKLRPYLNDSINVLEVGSGTGIIMFKIAPHVKFYKGIDISVEALELCKTELVKRNITNVSLQTLKASELSLLTEKFDLIIVNSVIQYFPSLTFVNTFIHKCTSLISNSGILFLGDIRDKRLQIDFYSSLSSKEFEYDVFQKEMNETELFLHPGFIEDCFTQCEFKTKVSFSKKNGTIQNELFKFRFDCLVEIDKKEIAIENPKFNKQQVFEIIGSFENPMLNALPTSASYVIYTSGSSGLPKGVIVENRQLVGFFQNIDSTFQINQNFIIGATTNYTFDISILELLGGFAVGVLTNLLNDPQPGNILDYIRAGKINVLQITPTRLAQLIEFDQIQIHHILSLLNILIIGGEKIDDYLFNFLKQLTNVKVIQVYGPTETTIWSTYAEINPELSKPLIGKPLLNETIYILDDNNKIQPIGVTGEIYIGGIGVAKEYLNNVDLTREKFIDNPFQKGSKMYKTGDFGCWQRDGNIEFKGRKDDQIKINGYRVELNEIEKVLMGFSGITYAVVIPVNNNSAGYELFAYILSDSILDKSAIISYLSNKLPKYMVPYNYIQIDDIPMMINGKLDRKKLVESYGNQVESSKLFIEPKNEIESNLVDMWKIILKASKISANDDFFKIGGDSLKATRLRSLILSKYKIAIELDQVFNNTTIIEQALVIENLLINSGTLVTKIPKAYEADYYPLSFSQRRLWILCQFEGANLAYNITEVFKLKGKLDIRAFIDSLCAVVKRHEILRTCFKKNDHNELHQYVINFENLNQDQFLNYVDLRDQVNEDEAIKKMIQRDFDKEFELDVAPLIRVKLYQIDDESFLFIYTMHHIISDAWSMGVFLNEFLMFYNAYLNNKKVFNHDLQIQYKDYSVWQNNYFSQLSDNKDEKYWVAQFNGNLPIINLPIDKPYPAHKTYNGNNIYKTFSKEHTAWLNKFSNENKGTLYMSSLTLVYILLEKYTGQNDIIIGTPIAGRDNGDLENQIGLYINTLALRVKSNQEDNYTSLFLKVRETVIDAYSHQNYPFDKLIAKLNLKRDLSRSPLFDVMVTLNNVENFNTQNLVNSEDLLIEEYTDLLKNTSKFSLSFSFTESGEELNLRLEYNSDIFNEDSMVRMVNNFEQLLIGIVKNSNVPLNQIEYITEQEKNLVLFDFNNTEAYLPQDKTIIDVFEEQVLNTPDKIAVMFENVQLTYNEVNVQSNQMAFYLRDKYSVKADDLIGIKLNRSEKIIIAILGILKSGAAYIPIDPDYPEERINYIKNDSQSKVIIDEAEIRLFYNIRAQYSSKNISRINKTEDLAYVIYTSGTTGNPKGVMVEQRSLVNYILFLTKYYKFKNEKVALLTTYTFDASVEQIFITLLNSSTLFIVSENTINDINKLNKYLFDNEITHIHSVPSLLNILSLDNNKTIRRIISAGEKYKVDLSERYLDKFELFNKYGPTEATISVLINKISSTNDTSLGKVISNTQVYILDENLKPLPIGTVGIMYISGVGVARGYLNNPQLTKEKFIPNPFLEGKRMYDTGDLCKWKSNGNIEFLGRMDRQVKIRGYRIELGEIESAILKYSINVKQSIVEEKDVNGEKALIAYIQCENEIEKSELRKFLQTKLPYYMIPAFYVILKNIPLMRNGKVNHKELQFIAEEEISESKKYVAPRSEEEKEMAQIWQDVLGIDKVGITDNFFELGGNSLNIFKVWSKLQNIKKQSIKLNEIYNFPTIEEMLGHEIKEFNLIQFNSSNSEIEKSIYFIPPVIGIPSIFQNLANILKNEMNCYAFNYYKESSEEKKYFNSIEEASRSFSEEIFNKHQDEHSNIIIFGYSMGGNVAFEMAKILEKKYKNINIFLIDSYVKTKIYDNKENINEVLREVQKYIDENNIIVDEDIKYSVINNFNIFNKYMQNGKINSKVYLFKSEDNKQNNSEWEQYLTNTLSLKLIFGNHWDALSDKNISMILEALLT